MKGRGFKLIASLAILVLALGVTGAAPAAPPSAPEATQETCPEGDGWVKYEGLSGTSFTIPPEDIPDGYHVGDNCFKAATTVVFGSGPTVTNTTVWNKEGCPDANGCNLVDISHASFELVQDPYEVCSITTTVYGEWSDWSDWFWNGEQFERTRTRSVTYYDSQNPEHVCDEDTESESEYDPACPYNPEIRSGDPACQPPPGEALATLAASCGGGANVTLAHAIMYIQSGDQDPIQVTETGQVPLDPGDYIAWAEALEGFEFPEGATTRWELSIDLCPRPPEEPPTGPLDSIPLSALAGIAVPGAVGLGLLVSAFRRRRH